ncbi:MAG TPA: sulfite dehydrogenase [Candidatus Tectomicrobia bacterium]|nr:sulfite dehydrogenase [Candidatus Tectomicrobia bacterium]
MNDSTPNPEASRQASSRRRFLQGGAALGVALATGAGRSLAGQPQPASDDPSKVLGGPLRPYGERSRFEQTVREKFIASPTDEFGGSQTPLEETLGIITPSALHFVVQRGGLPDIDPAKQRLLIHGLVDRPVTLSVEEIKRLPSTSRILFLECQGNTQLEWRAPTGKNIRQTHGSTSCSEWTGVPLALLLREAGVQQGASWIVAEGADGSGNERSIPIAKVMDDVLVAYGQNGEALRPENGYPLRLIVPGWTGNINVKWLRRLTVVDRPYLTRMDGVGQPTLMPDGKARQLQFVLEAKSVITFPSAGQQLPGPGFYEIKGLAWSGRGLVRRVEVSTDGGKTWRDARLQEPVLPLAHTRFRLDWRWDGGEAVLQSRCTDETGYVQPTRAALVKVRGLNSRFFNNAIQSWQLAADGSVHNVHV